MAYRLSVIILFSLFWVTLSYPQTVEKINVKSAGWKDISQYLVLDLDLPASFKGSSYEKDTTTLAIYRAYRDNFTISLIKNLIEKEDLTTRKKILYNILSDTKDSKDLEIFYKNFGSLLSSSDFEDINFLYHFKAGKLKEYKSKKPLFNDLKEIVLAYGEEQYKRALELITSYKDTFPRVYTLILFKNKNFSDALEFLEKQEIEDRDYLMAVASYYLKKYDKVIELLSNKRLGYKEKLLLIDAMTAKGNYNIPDFEKPADFSNNLSDEFTILRSLRLVDTLEDKNLKEQADIFRIKWQMKNYAYHLNLYLDEIKVFQEKLKNVEKGLSSVNTYFDKVYETYKEDPKLKDLQQKIVSINETYNRIKKFRKTIDKDYRELSFFQEAYEKEKREIDKLFKNITEKYNVELERINIEIYARKIEKIILENKNLTAEDIINLLTALKKLDSELENKNLSFDENILYYQIYLINELLYMSSKENNEERTILMNNATELAKKYLGKFKERKAEVTLFLAETYEELGEYEKALKTFFDYLNEKKEGDFRVYMKIAELLFEKKDYQRAISFYEKAGASAKVYKDSAYYKIGWSYYLSGQYDKVINLFLNYKFESLGQRQELLLNEMIDLLSRAFYKIDNLDLVENYLDKNRQFPYPDKVFKYLGDLYLYLADYEKAISVYKKGLDRYYLFKNSHEIALSIIDAYNFMGKQEQAYKERVRYIQKYDKNSEYYKKYREFPPDFGDEIIMTAFYYNNLYDKEKKDDHYLLATQLYESLLDYFPSHKRAGEVAFMLAQLYEDKNDNKRAVKYFREARRLKFNEEESYYRSLFCEYKMWKRHEILSRELINSLEDFLINFKKSKYLNDSALVLADISLKEGLTEKMFFALEVAGSNDSGLKRALEFVEANFDGIENKLFISKLFDKGYKNFNDDKYLKLKHFSLFKHAILLEGEGKRDFAINTYNEIINDKSSEFTEFAIYNLSLLLQRDGKTEEAVKYMSKIKQKDDLRIKAKDFIYNFGKQKGMFIESAQAALDYASLSKEKEIFYLIESSYLFLKGKNYDDSERVLYQLESKRLTEREKKEKDFVKGLLYYYKNNFDKAYDLLIAGLKADILDRFGTETEEPLHNVLAKVVFTKPEDEAREALELYVGYLSKKFKETGDDLYLYKLGDIINEFSLFFLQQEEAKLRAVALLKRAVKNSVEKGNKDLVLKSLTKLREIDPEKYGRKLKIDKLDVNFESIINYENLIK
ncbi:MAG: tetratricopeptide repeat protein [Proteobacteria bacterium]|nr:tetratricopeptide repeat protein [Pseudomonadota bacterium]